MRRYSGLFALGGLAIATHLFVRSLMALSTTPITEFPVAAEGVQDGPRIGLSEGPIAPPPRLADNPIVTATGGIRSLEVLTSRDGFVHFMAVGHAYDRDMPRTYYWRARLLDATTSDLLQEWYYYEEIVEAPARVEINPSMVGKLPLPLAAGSYVLQVALVDPHMQGPFDISEGRAAQPVEIE